MSRRASSPLQRRSGWGLSATLAVAIGIATLPATAGASPATAACDNRNNNTYAKLLECADLDGARAHQAALQAIADANGGTRASGTPGYRASVDYVAQQMTSWGYDVTVQEFQFPFYRELSPAVLENQTEGISYTPDVDFATMTYSGNGDTTAVAEGVDLQLPPGAVANSSTSGCEASDFAGFTAGNIAVVQRGTCSFAQKALNAENHGASGVIIFNEGQPGRTAAFRGTLSSPGISIPVVGTSFAIGTSILGDTVRLATDTESEFRASWNVLAETQTGRDDNVVMAGAHLDSVLAGPGIQDNGTGSAALLEVAHAMRKLKPENTVRFAWWGSEEFGLLGSNHYVANLSPAELDAIALYLNFDMIGSPNYVRFIYDGDGSAFGLSGPTGSATIEGLFEDFYGHRGLASEPTQISFRSDYAAFFRAGIPFGGLFTGAEGIKTPAQAAVYGGTAGDQYDPCYHLACDTFSNISLEVFDLNIDAVAFSVLTYAYSTESVNGVPGRTVPGGLPAGFGTATAPVGAGAPSGGLEHDHDDGEVM